MRGVIFVETLRRTWWQMLYWGVGLGAMALISAVMVPFFGSTQIIELLRGLPPILLAASGLDADLTALSTPEGIITVAFFGKFALIFAAYPVVMGMRVTANDEDDGVLDVVLSLPVPRWQVMIERFAAYLVSIVAIAFMVFIGLWLGTMLADVPLNMGRMVPMVINVIPVLTLVMAFTVLAAAIFRRRQVALAVATVFVVASFMLDTIASMVQGGLATVMHAISIFGYYDPGSVVDHGLIWTNVIGMVLVAALLVGGALWAFQHRDVGV